MAGQAKFLKVRQQRLVDLKNYDDAVVHPKIQDAIKRAIGEKGFAMALFMYRRAFVAKHAPLQRPPSISTP